MPDSPLSLLTSAAAFTGSELFYTVQGGNDRKATSSQFYQYITTVSTLGGTGTTLGPFTPNQVIFANSSNNVAGMSGTVWSSSTLSLTSSGASRGWVLGFGAGVQAGGVSPFTIDASLSDISNVAALDIVLPPPGPIRAIQFRNSTDANAWLAWDFSGGLPVLSLGPGGATSRDTAWIRTAPATWQFGFGDSNAPVAQTQQVQSVIGGFFPNTAGADWTFVGSKGTGTGAGGNIVWKVAPAGPAGAAQNTAIERMRLRDTGMLTLVDPVSANGSLSIGSSVDLNLDSFGTTFQNVQNGSAFWLGSYITYGNHASDASQAYAKTRGTVASSQVAVVQGDRIYGKWVYGSNGTNYNLTARERYLVSSVSSATGAVVSDYWWDMRSTDGGIATRYIFRGNGQLQLLSSNTVVTAIVNGVAAEYAHTAYGGV